MQDFGKYKGLHIWLELSDDSLQVNDQSQIILFARNEKSQVHICNIQIKLSIKPKGPMLLVNPVTIERLVPGRTAQQSIPLNVGNSKKGKYEIALLVDFHLEPETWKMEPILFHVQ